jgi:hypothetical protein
VVDLRRARNRRRIDQLANPGALGGSADGRHGSGMNLPRLLALGVIGTLSLGSGVLIYLLRGPAMLTDRLASATGWLCM